MVGSFLNTLNSMLEFFSYVPRNRNCEFGSFLMLWPDISPFGRITSDFVTGRSVAQFVAHYHTGGEGEGKELTKFHCISTV